MEKERLIEILVEITESAPGKIIGSSFLEDIGLLDSMATISLISVIDEEAGVTLEVEKLGDCQTVDDLVGLVCL